MKLPSTLQSPHELYPLLPMSRSPAPVLLYNPGEKRGEALPIPHPHALTELPQRHRCPLLLRVHTLEAEKPETTLATGPSLTTLAGSPPPIRLVFCVPCFCSSVLGLNASEL